MNLKLLKIECTNKTAIKEH